MTKHDGPVCSECGGPYKAGIINHYPGCVHLKTALTQNIIAIPKKIDNEDQAYKFAEIWPPKYYQPVREYRFVAVRFGIGKPGIRQRIAEAGLYDFRMDYAWPNLRVAVGVDGQAYNVKGGGRHSTDKDRFKHNLATLWGWMFFHFSPTQIEKDPYKVVEMVYSAIKIREANTYVIET